MVSKKYWDKQVSKFVDLLKQEKEERSVSVLGTEFGVLPGVFSPVYSSDTVWFAEKLIPLIKGKRLLEIGSGTGIIACLAAINGASHVVATDINPIAVENIHLNAKKYNLDIEVALGSMFEPVDSDDRFDFIFWNHPFNYCEGSLANQDMVTRSVFDTRYEALGLFFREGRNYLKKGGRLLLGTSNIARINLIKRLFKEGGYRSILLEKTDVPVYKGKKTKMDLRLYGFEEF